MTTFKTRSAALCALLATTALAAPVYAAPYEYRDANGVNLTDGTFSFQLVEGTIGSGESQLTLTSTNGKIDFEGYTLTISPSGPNTIAVVSLGDVTDNFTISSSPNSTRATGATLTATSPTTYVYRAMDGSEITFDNPATVTGGASNLCDAQNVTNCFLLATQIAAPSGRTILLDWEVYGNCTNTFPVDCTYFWRLKAVENNASYRADWTFVTNSVPPNTNPSPSWFERSSATLSNTAVSSPSWPTISYAYPSSTVTNITTTNGVFRLTKSGGNVTAVRRPGAGSDNLTVSYGVNGVSSVTNEGVTTSYNRTVSGSTATMVVTDALSNQTTIVSDMVKYRPTSVTDALTNTTSYTYDGNGRTTEIAYPEGNQTEFVYDSRGNVTSTTLKAKPASGLSDISTTASYPSTCVNLVTCNKPDWTRDALGNQTDYAYDSTTGLTTTVTRPAPTGGGTRPQTRYSYTTTSGVALLTGVSACATGTAPSCVGTSDEVKATIGYDSNHQRTTETRGNGTGTLTATTTIAYDPIGNPITVDGPLSGTADTTRARYDSGRRVIGIVGPDPDGGSARLHKAQRFTYNSDSQVTLAEIGTVTSQTDPAWAAFSSLQQLATTYDANARPVKTETTAGGTTYAVTQTSYDTLGRVDCVAQRMDPAQWSSQTVVCTPQTTGTDGADRVRKTYYDELSRTAKIQTAYGTSDQADEVQYTYTDNGRRASASDGEGNPSAYQYDGHDRLWVSYYPTTNHTGINWTDYEQYTYDDNGSIVNIRLRDNQNIGLTYDNLNQLTAKDVPNVAYNEFDITYSYDLLGRLTAASNSAGGYVTRSYDALSRMLTDNNQFYGKTLQYDLAGRMTRFTWADSNYVDYDYDVVGNVTAIRENGASSGAGLLATYAYDNLGHRTGITRGNGTVASYSYDPVSRLSSLGENFPGTTHDFTLGFTYNPASQIATNSRSNDLFAWNGYVNRNDTEIPNGLNQLTAQGSTSLTYDTRGNVSAIASTPYTYTSENRLATSPATSLYHDPLGRLLWSTIGIRYDATGSQITTELSGSTNATMRRYVWGPGTDEPIVWYEGSGTTDRRWLHADERGSIIAISNGSGAVTNINSYDEYGVPATGNVGRFQYTGQAWLPELGMSYYKARIYNPGIGRFM